MVHPAIHILWALAETEDQPHWSAYDTCNAYRLRSCYSSLLLSRTVTDGRQFCCVDRIRRKFFYAACIEGVVWELS